MSKVLVIDDEPGMRQVITKILQPDGHIVFGAEDGAQSLELCKLEMPDIVFLDISLPDMDSSEILAGLKKIKPQLPVVILSGFGEIDVALELVKLGAVEYISKPFKIEEFLRMAKKVLNRDLKTPSPVPPARSPAPPPLPVKQDKPPAQPSTAAREQELPADEEPVSGKLSLIKVAVVAVAAALIGFGVYLYLNKPVPGASFQVPYSNPSGLSWDGKSLWACDWMAETVYKHKNDSKLSVENLYKITDKAPSGIACGNNYIWAASPFEGKIYRLNPDAELSVSAEYKSPGASPSGLYHDGANLWSLDFQLARVYKHKDDGALSVEQTFDSPAENPKGIFKHGEYFFIADAKTNRIYKVTAENFAVAGIYIIPQFEADGLAISGIAFDGKNIWACADGVQKLFRESIKGLKVVQR
ncbi:MAG: hypothetical protein A2339_07850 [Elusimicrobia bacterium RIFOXYB12_FULL_50_12]|nr:MAG: hypothetical protein A2278_02880 [Elusimicrobia bacterium RIFOXYA12_FULL_49_49]OGS16426.1 MAG: hypothetical protein A2251_06335 [Elusimicrobia bacterium RIFOXYA2_FULL_47_53]OGS27199.1 MAG: hypothetical protein A2339_07850 [Elusimicrobia bacterium RIFOXYB12_FULL_50_12]OGS30398.1 MAG: hypothetical protein A2323_02710 [Elusimicrobia bacterium RIFOXYB2_FULL_46_23]